MAAQLRRVDLSAELAIRGNDTVTRRRDDDDLSRRRRPHVSGASTRVPRGNVTTPRVVADGADFPTARYNDSDNYNDNSTDNDNGL